MSEQINVLPEGLIQESDDYVERPQGYKEDFVYKAAHSQASDEFEHNAALDQEYQLVSGNIPPLELRALQIYCAELSGSEASDPKLSNEFKSSFLQAQDEYESGTFEAREFLDPIINGEDYDAADYADVVLFLRAEQIMSELEDFINDEEDMSDETSSSADGTVMQEGTSFSYN